jgi:anion-transporting  ArsA/GET3 family ATPase
VTPASKDRLSIDVLQNERVLITCGSGGVGKTTTAAAIAAGIAHDRGQRVLVLTIDPAKRLATALGMESVGNRESQVALPKSAKPNAELWVAMLDTSASWDELVRRHAPDETTRDRILANPLYRNITQRFVQSHDYIAMERLHELYTSDRYDLIVVDTPPSRHAIDFLDAPERMKDFFSSTLLKWITLPYRLGGERAGKLGYLAAKPFYQVADKILGSQFLQDVAEFFLLFQGMYGGFVERAGLVAALLTTPQTAFVVVTTPEPSPMHEADYFVTELAKRKLRLGAVIMNRVAVEAVSDLNGTGPLAADSVATASAFLQREISKSVATTSPLQRVAHAAATTHLRQVELAEVQRKLWQRFAPTAPVRMALAEQAHVISDVSSLVELGQMLLRSPLDHVRGSQGRRPRKQP